MTKHIVMLLSKSYINDPRVTREAKALIAAGYNVTVISWDRHGKHKTDEVIDGVRVVRIKNTRMMRLLPHDLLRNPLWWWHAYKKCVTLIKTGNNFAVIHCHDLDTLAAGVLVKNRLKKILVYDAHEIFSYMIIRSLPTLIGKLADYFEKMLTRYVDRIITVNEPLKKYFQSFYSKKIDIIMNCKEIPSPCYKPPTNPIFTISYIGLLDKARMFPEIVNILGKIQNIQFVIAGRKENLYEHIKELSKQYQNITFLGTIPENEVVPKTLEAHIVLCVFDPQDPNNKVGLPNKIFESMASGRPVLVTKNLYSAEFVNREQCGIAIEYSGESIIKEITKLQQHPQLCETLGKNGLNAAIREYNWDTQKQTLQKLYTEVLT